MEVFGMNEAAPSSKFADLPKRDEVIYRDEGLNSRVLSVEVNKGKVRMNEDDYGPACSMMNGEAVTTVTFMR